MKLLDFGAQEQFTITRKNNMKYLVSFQLYTVHQSMYLYFSAVLPPDEDAQPFKNNSVFTNAIASLSIRLADRVSCITRKNPPQAWLDIASNLHFPFDDATQTHLEYEGFDLSK